jgi:hypothetical protein
MCRVKPLGAGFTEIRLTRAHEVELSMSPIPINPTLKGFTQCKNHVVFFKKYIFLKFKIYKFTVRALYY